MKIDLSPKSQGVYKVQNDSGDQKEFRKMNTTKKNRTVAQSKLYGQYITKFNIEYKQKMAEGIEQRLRMRISKMQEQKNSNEY